MRRLGRLAVALLCLLAGALAGLIALELALRALPVSKGLYRERDPARVQWQGYEPGLPWVHSIGWDLREPRGGRTNNFGQPAPFDYEPGDECVALIGDSFVEGQLNWYADTLQGRLAQYLGPVYAFGLGGNSLSDYLALARSVTRSFHPRALVFLVVDGDIIESMDRDQGHFRFVPGARGMELAFTPLQPLSWRGHLLRKIGESSLLYYVFSNLRARPADLKFSWRHVTDTPHAAPRSSRQGPYRAIVDAFVEGVAATGVPPARVVLVLDSDRYALYDAHLASVPKDAPPARALLASEARRRGFTVVDMDATFRADWNVHHRTFDYYPMDRHWNAHGNALAAARIDAALAPVLRDSPAPSCKGGTATAAR